MTTPSLHQTVEDYFKINWNPANTNSRTPTINSNDTSRRQATASYDIVLIYELDGDIKEIGLTRAHINRADSAKIRIGTTVDLAQLMRMETEVERLLYAMKTNPTTYPTGAQYHMIRPKGGWIRAIDGVNLWVYELRVEGISDWEPRT